MRTVFSPGKEVNGRDIVVDGMNLHYNEMGNGEAVIMLHGGGPGTTGWNNFYGNIGEISKHFRVLLLDLPGWGGSAGKKPIVVRKERPSFNARAVKGFMKGLGIRKASFVGNSMGGATTTSFAIQFPDLVDKIVLTGAAGAAPLSGSGPLGDAFVNPTEANIRKWALKAMVYNPQYVTDELIESRRRAMSPQHRQGFLRSKGLAINDLSPGYPKIRSETFIVWGREDASLPLLENGVKMLTNIPNAEMHVFPHCGHWVMIERVDEFNKLVLDFLEG